MKRSICKYVAMMLVGLAILVPTLNTVHAINNTDLPITEEYELKEKFDELGEDDIVAYLDGIPILKRYISEDGQIEIPEEVMTLKTPDNPEITSRYEFLSPDQESRAILPSGSRAEVIKILADPQARFGQQTNDYYLSVLQGRELAAKFDVKPWPTAIKFSAAYLVGKFCNGSVGTAMGLYDLMSTLQSANIGSKIRSYTDKSQRVRYRVLKTTYGTFYAVNHWDGRTIDLSVVSGKEKIAHTHYK